MTDDPTPLIRPYEAGDFESLHAVLNEVVERGDAFVYEAAFSIDETRRWIESYATVHVATVKGQVVGGYLLRPNQPGRGAHVANASYMVSASARGRGIGRSLGEHSLRTAKVMGFAAMQFNAVVATNAGAVALWFSLGFSIVGTIPDAFRRADGRFVALHVMHRPL